MDTISSGTSTPSSASPCPLCESTTAPKFSDDSDWCVGCAGAELDLQAHEEREVVRHQVFEP